MNAQARETRSIGVAVTAIVVVLLVMWVATSFYLTRERQIADVFVMQRAAQGIGREGDVEAAIKGGSLEGSMLYAHLYFGSDSARRRPSEAFRRVWVANRALDSFYRDDAERDFIPLEDVALGRQAINAFSGVAKLVRDRDGVRGFDNSSGALEAALLESLNDSLLNLWQEIGSTSVETLGSMPRGGSAGHGMEGP